jgi:hypothetical protein
VCVCVCNVVPRLSGEHVTSPSASWHHTAFFVLGHGHSQAAATIQPEEKERIGRFVFAVDAKLAMGGRLLIRRAVCDVVGVDNRDVVLTRSKERKPFLKEPRYWYLPVPYHTPSSANPGRKFHTALCGGCVETTHESLATLWSRSLTRS